MSPEPVKIETAAPVFEIIPPLPSPLDSIPTVPRGIETTPENWSFVSDDFMRDIPTPLIDGATGPAAPKPSWLQTEMGIGAEPEPPQEIFPEPVAAASVIAVDTPADVPASDSTLLPVPGILESREPAAPAAEAPALDLESVEPHPEGLVQIACLFPEGEEKTGQNFVNRLRDAAVLLKKPLTILPVFLHTWSAGAVDVPAWLKSAALSGADAMFVIAPRCNQTLFSSIAKEAQVAGTSGRVVVAEHLQSPALYADILVELNRRSRGPR